MVHSHGGGVHDITDEKYLYNDTAYACQKACFPYISVLVNDKDYPASWVTGPCK